MNKKMLLAAFVVIFGGFQVARADLAGLAKRAGSVFEQAKKVVEEAAPIFGPTKVFGKDTKVSFEVKNKADKPVYFKVMSGEVLYEEDGKNLFTAEPGKTTQLQPSITKETTIHFWMSKPTEDQSPDRIYKVDADKTMYLTWDGTRLRPQTGPAQGRLGKTDTGLSLREPGNVLPTQIRLQQ